MRRAACFLQKGMIAGKFFTVKTDLFFFRSAILPCTVLPYLFHFLPRKVVHFLQQIGCAADVTHRSGRYLLFRIGQNIMADAVSAVIVLPVGGILAPSDLQFFEICLDFPAADIKQRPDDLYAVLVFAGRANAFQSHRTGATEQVKQHGFRPIVLWCATAIFR